MRFRLGLALAVVVVAVAALAVPALGGPSLPAIAKQAARALKLAKGADRRSKRALALARKTAGRSQPGTPGTNGTVGSQGVTGPAGPPAPSGAQKIDFRADPGTGDTSVFNFGGLVITARCDAGPNLTVRATSTVADSELHISGATQASGSPAAVVYAENDHLGPGSPGVAFPSGNFEGTFSYSTPAGTVVSGTVAAEQTAFNGTKGCWFGGWALHDPA